MNVRLKSANVDDRRRVVLPEDCPPNSAVTIQQLDEETWLIKRQRPRKDYKVVLIPAIEELPDDAEWEKFERKVVDHTSKRVPALKE